MRVYAINFLKLINTGYHTPLQVHLPLSKPLAIRKNGSEALFLYEDGEQQPCEIAAYPMRWFIDRECPENYLGMLDGKEESYLVFLRGVK